MCFLLTMFTEYSNDVRDSRLMKINENKVVWLTWCQMS